MEKEIITSSDHITVTMSLDTIISFDTTFAFVIHFE
jgi:hypothetical protein